MEKVQSLPLKAKGTVGNSYSIPELKVLAT